MDPKDDETTKAKEVAPLTSVTFDADLYGGDNRFEGYERSIPVTEEDDDQNDGGRDVVRKMASITGPKSIKDLPGVGAEDDDSGFKKPQRIIDREDDYRRRRLNRIISPDRNDPFASGEKTPDPSVRTYGDVMREEALKRQKEELLKEIAKKKEEEKNNKAAAPAAAPEPAPQKRRNRWDQSQDDDSSSAAKK